MLGGFRYTRSPRYILGENDRRQLKFTSSRSRARKIMTQVYDLSATGISFFSSKKLAPEPGETVAVEFFVPGFTQVACHGRVARVEEILFLENGDSLWAQKVGVEFLNLPTHFREVLESRVGEALTSKPGRAVPARLRYRHPVTNVATKAPIRKNHRKTDTQNAAWLALVVVVLVLAGRYLSLNQKRSPANQGFGDNFAKAVLSK